MPRKTLLLITVLILLTGGLVSVAVRLEKTRQSEKSLNKVSVTPAQTEKSAVLSFDPASLTLSNTTSTMKSLQTVDITIDSPKSEVTGVQLELSYDPQIIQNVTLAPFEDNDSFFGNDTNHIILRKIIDPTSGHISFIIGAKPFAQLKKGTGRIARLTFTVVKPTAGSQTKIQFVRGTIVTKPKEYGSILKVARSLTIFFSQEAQ